MITNELKDVMQELQRAKNEIRTLQQRLTDEIANQPELIKALQTGLVKLNFPAPSGFHAYIRNYKF